MDRLPEGWKGCPKFANGLIENTFLAFKTPIQNSPSSDFTINDVLERTKNQQWNLGLWIDLTNTTRYYSGSSVTKEGVQYIKLRCVGHESPSHVETNQFIDYCRKFLVQNPGKIIGVHCTHGLNRTGFLICAYLCSVKRYKATVALQTFAAVRPPGIFRQNLVDDLVKRFGLPREPLPPKVSPILPWNKLGSGTNASTAKVNTYTRPGEASTQTKQELPSQERESLSFVISHQRQILIPRRKQEKVKDESLLSAVNVAPKRQSRWDQTTAPRKGGQTSNATPGTT